MRWILHYIVRMFVVFIGNLLLEQIESFIWKYYEKKRSTQPQMFETK